MKRGILVMILLISFCLTANAKTYVLRDKLTGEPKGTVSISDKHINDWAKDYILMEASKEYRGKQSHEIKYENGELRLATEQEINDYLDSIKPPTEKEMLLGMLEDEDVQTKIKEIKDAEPIMTFEGTEKSRWQRTKDKVKEIYRIIRK